MNIIKKRAVDMAKHAYRTVPLYYRLAEKQEVDLAHLEFDELPVVDKSMYVESGMSCLSSEYISDYLTKKLRWIRTSGSTGKYTEVYWDKTQERSSLLELWMLRKRYYNITARDRLCYFYPSEKETDKILRRNYFCAYPRMSLLDKRCETTYQDILEYNPEWMILQPGLALVLADIAERTGRIPDQLRYIEIYRGILRRKCSQSCGKDFPLSDCKPIWNEGG